SGENSVFPPKPPKKKKKKKPHLSLLSSSHHTNKHYTSPPPPPPPPPPPRHRSLPKERGVPNMNAPAQTRLFSKRAQRLVVSASRAGVLLLFLACLFSSRPLTPQSPPQFVYTADESTHMISAFVLNPTNGALTPAPGSPFNERLDPYALAVDPAGKFLFVANHSTSDVSALVINQTP